MSLLLVRHNTHQVVDTFSSPQYQAAYYYFVNRHTKQAKADIRRYYRYNQPRKKLSWRGIGSGEAVIVAACLVAAFMVTGVITQLTLLVVAAASVPLAAAWWRRNQRINRHITMGRNQVFSLQTGCLCRIIRLASNGPDRMESRLFQQMLMSEYGTTCEQILDRYLPDIAVLEQAHQAAYLAKGIKDDLYRAYCQLSDELMTELAEVYRQYSHQVAATTNQHAKQLLQRLSS